jgi:epoxyqueuosine reductase
VCPWNVRFAKSLPQESPYQPREVIAGKDARTLARDLLAMTQEEFGRAFSKSPMKRAKLRGLRRNAAVVLGNPSPALRADSGQAARAEDVRLLERTRDEAPDEMVRAHAAWALERIRDGAP